MDDRGESADVEFKRIAKAVSSNIQKICENANQMQKMISQLGSSDDSESFKSELHNVQHYTKTLSTDTKDKLKDMKELLTDVPLSEQRAQKLFLERLTNDFTTALSKFQEIQRSEAEREKEQVKMAHNRSYKLQPPPGRTNANEIPLEPSSYQRQVFLDEDGDLQNLQDREAAINRLEEDIRDVNDIFKDIATLVHAQGDVVDSIEASVESAVVQVDEGVVQLNKASQYQARARKKKLCLAVIGVVILLVLILIIYLSTKN
ncbi:unnamed protein product [Notodromas monacha]|uniref:t-SNARE coiled-coil homology domain-containing protein n=1 Tax=Notodromas monacha TaxID=399045 RepID=A0A7R9BXF9_9CRUS|nr:unnamed protein product [Notodromas monacha]CAG0922018.1 unnamed protein product [Notodromas monacha]